MQEEFASAMDGTHNFTGEYAYGTRTKTSPNPCIVLNEAGFVGLPLSPRDAKYIASVADQVPIGLEEGTQHISSLQSSKLSFANPLWQDFIKTMAYSSCNRLSMNISSASVRCELDSLILHEPGSR